MFAFPACCSSAGATLQVAGSAAGAGTTSHFPPEGKVNTPSLRPRLHARTTRSLHRAHGVELAQQRRNELCHRRVDVHGLLQRGVGRVLRHHVEERMNGLVAAGAEDRAAQDPLRFRIDGDFHETQRLALLDRAADARHRSHADHRLAAERRISVRSCRRDRAADR